MNLRSLMPFGGARALARGGEAATFIKGVLNVTLPKSKAAEAKTRKIEVKKAG